MNILITGGLGFIGFNTLMKFINGHNNCNSIIQDQKSDINNIIIIDNLNRETSLKNLNLLKYSIKKGIIINDKIKVLTRDIRDKKILDKLKDQKFDIIFHFAAQVAVTKSITNPIEDFEINALGSLNILEYARKYSDDAVLIYSSTNKVYGSLNELKLDETAMRYDFKEPQLKKKGISEKTPLNPNTPYGCSKALSDVYFQDYFKTYNLKTIVFRQSCIYGPYQFGSEDQGWIAYLMKSAIHNKKINIYGTGKQVRDILYISDLIDAYELAYKNINKTKGECYNIGGGYINTLSILEYLYILAKIRFPNKFNKDLSDLNQVFSNEIHKIYNLEFKDFRLNDQKCFYCDISKAKQDFNWEPKISYENGIKTLLN